MKNKISFIWRPTSNYYKNTLGLSPIKNFKLIPSSDTKSTLNLIWALFCRDFKSEYRQSLLGYIWALVPVLATTLTWVFLNQQNLVKIGPTETPYPLHVLVGTMLWGLFSKSLTGVMQGFSSGSSVFVKIKSSPIAFALSGLSQVWFDLLLQCIILVPAFFLFDIKFTPLILLAPFGMFGLSLLGSAFGMILIPIASLYNDISRATTFALGFLMYLTPVVYPVPKEGFASIIVSYNPVTPLMEWTRSLLTGVPIYNFASLGWVFLFSLLLNLVGIWFLKVSFPHLVARMGS